MNRIKKILHKLKASLSSKEPALFPDSKSIAIGESFSIGKYRSLIIENGATITLAKNVMFREFCSILVFANGKLAIGENVFFNNSCSINCLDKIEIGDDTIFGEGVKIYDHNHRYAYTPSLQVDRNGFTTAPVTIGKNCWIGSNVTILKGVTIGDNVIVGANCLILKPVPANSIVKHNEKLIIEAAK